MSIEDLLKPNSYNLFAATITADVIAPPGTTMTFDNIIVDGNATFFGDVTLPDHFSNSVLYLDGSNNIASELLGDDQVIMGNPPTATTLVGGTGITLVSGSNSLTIENTGGNVTSDDQTVFGPSGSRLVASSNNTIYGYQAGPQILQSTSDAASNTGFGSSALGGLTGTTYNTAVGASAGLTITSGSQNTCIGAFADVDSGTAQNRVSLGFNCVNSNDNTILLGSNSSTDLSVGNFANYTIGTINSPASVISKGFQNTGTVNNFGQGTASVASGGAAFINTPSGVITYTTAITTLATGTFTLINNAITSSSVVILTTSATLIASISGGSSISLYNPTSGTIAAGTKVYFYVC